MTLYPLGIQSNLSPLGINPVAVRAPRLPVSCVPCLSVLALLPDIITTDTMPTLGLALLMPPLALDTAMAAMDGYNVLSAVEARDLIPVPDVSACPC